MRAPYDSTSAFPDSDVIRTARLSELSVIRALHFVRSAARWEDVVVSLQDGKASEHFSMAALGLRVETSARIVVGEAGSKTEKLSSPAGDSSGQSIREGSFKSDDSALLPVEVVEDKARTDDAIRLLERPNSLEELIMLKLRIISVNPFLTIVIIIDRSHD